MKQQMRWSVGSEKQHHEGNFKVWNHGTYDDCWKTEFSSKLVDDVRNWVMKRRNRQASLHHP